MCNYLQDLWVGFTLVWVCTSYFGFCYITFDFFGCGKVNYKKTVVIIVLILSLIWAVIPSRETLKVWCPVQNIESSKEQNNGN